MKSDLSKTGLFFLLNTPELRAKLESLHLLDGRAVFDEKADPAIVSRLVSKVISEEVEQYISDKIKGLSKEELKEPTWINKVINDLPGCGGLPDNSVPIDNKILKEIKITSDAIGTKRPTTELNECSLIVPDGKTPSLGNEIRLELESADHADWLVSFIKLSAIRSFYDQLQAFCGKSNPDGSPRLRIATTTYIGATDSKALELLFNLPNTEIKVCFNTSQTRLHAKAYLFRRQSAFSTAYIGSANLSAPAMSSGMEWTVKVAQSEIPYLYSQAVQAFEGCWNDQNFKLCKKEDLDEIKASLKAARIKMSKVEQGSESDILRSIVLLPHTFQEKMLEALKAERDNGKTRHLVVSATGTGKTMVAAFDYAKQIPILGRQPKLLYIAHRKDILKSAANKYKAVLKNNNFGCVLSDGDDLTAVNGDQIFCTPRTWKSHFKDNGQYTKDFFDLIVMDECHHSDAKSYQDILEYYKNSIEDGKTDLLGLTATPFRTDGEDIRPYFGGNFTHELSLAEAIENGHIVPFNYFGIDDDTDFTEVEWGHGATEREIASAISHNGQHLNHVFKTLTEYVQSPNSLRAIGFCAGLEHARKACDFMNGNGIKSAFLSGDSSSQERQQVMDDMSSIPPKTNMVFVADLFNEGVDIPCVNTVLMMRPTNSPLVFVQQLGRGLRNASIEYEKKELLVLDFVGNHNNKFKGFSRYVQMSTRNDIPIEKQINMGMPFLPSGCSITLTKQARKKILDNIKDYTAALRGQTLKRHLIECIRNAGREMNLKELMNILSVESPAPIYKISRPALLNSEAINDLEIDDNKYTCFNNIAQNDSSTMIEYWVKLLKGQETGLSRHDIVLAKFFLLSAFDSTIRIEQTENSWSSFVSQHGMISDMLDFLEWRISRIEPLHKITFPHTGKFLELHRTYNSKQISAAIGQSGSVIMQGIHFNRNDNFDSFFVTINKSETEFTPSTMYQDYAKSPKIFHWETPSRMTTDTREVRRYLDDQAVKMIFIRQNKKVHVDITGQYDISSPTAYYTFLGPVKKVLGHENENPVGIDFEMEYDIPADVFAYAKGA